MSRLHTATGDNCRKLKRKVKQRLGRPVLEPMECRRLLSAAIAPLGAMDITADVISLGAFKLHSSHTAKGAVGVTSNDTVYQVDVTAEINLGLTLEHLLQKDKVYLD